MSTAHPTEPGMVVLASGAVGFVGDRGVVERWTCSWLVRVATNNPEPDFPEDCYRDIDCGAAMLVHPDLPRSFVCRSGHERIPMDVRYHSGREWEDTCREMEDELSGRAFDSLAHVV